LDPREPLRELEWRLRNAWTWSPRARSPRRARGEAFLSAFAGDAAVRLRELRGSFDLSRWPEACSRAELLEALWLLDVLDRCVLSSGPLAPGLDIGSKNWSYLPALVAGLPGPWTGVELDAHRRYWNLTTRRAVAERRAALFPGVRFAAGSVLAQRGEFGLVTWLLPFVRPRALRAWGLPARFFEPERLLGHAWERVARGGLLFVVNQGAAEAEAQERLFRGAGVPARPMGRLSSCFPAYRAERFGWLARKEPARARA